MRSRRSCPECREETAKAVGYARMKPRHKRMALIGGGLAVLGVAAALVLNAFQTNLVFFFSPTQVLANEAPAGRRVPHRRHGGDGQPQARRTTA